MLPALLFTLSCASPQTFDGPQTIVMVVLDTVRADHLSLCGYQHPTSPALEQLRDQGASVSCRAHSPSSWTLPSHATYFTGKDLHQHNAGNGPGATVGPNGSVNPLDDRFPTLAEDLQARGYQTLMLTANPIISDTMGLTRGFERAVVAPSLQAFQTRQLRSSLDALLTSVDPDRPLFLFLNIINAHSPWVPIPAAHSFLPQRSGIAEESEIRQQLADGSPDVQASLAHLTDLYDYGVQLADSELAYALTAMKQRGLLEGHYRLVITSDHGEYLGEHQEVTHATNALHEPVTAVPLVYLDTNAPLALPETLSAAAVYSLARDGLFTDAPTHQSGKFRTRPAEGAADAPCLNTSAALWAGYDKLMCEGGEVVRFDLLADPHELQPLPADDHPNLSALLSYTAALDTVYHSRPADPDASVLLQELGYLDAE